MQVLIDEGSEVSGSIGQQATHHCEVSITVRIGESAKSREGHVVRRVSRSEWEVVSCPPEASYQYDAGQVVLGRVVFWRMNGLEHKLH
jgi:hypothetical protein